MKKIVSVLLTVVLVCVWSVTAFAESALPGFGEYEHVFVIGIDGAGAAFSLRDTPNFDRIFADNAFRHDAHTEVNTTSAQNWGSILCGVDYETHGFTNASTKLHTRTSDSDNPSIFYYVRQAMPDAPLVSFNHWSNINHGIIETDLGVRKINRGSDVLLTDAIVDYIEQGSAPALLFVQLDSVDHAAHTYGGFSKQYYQAVEKMDILLGRIYDAIDAQGWMENSLFIVVADHGETTHGHGGTTKEESSAIVAVAGKSVNAYTLPESTHNRDVSAIALYALGVERPAHFITSVPEGLFGAARAKTVAPNPMTDAERIRQDFWYRFVRVINRILYWFD